MKRLKDLPRKNLFDLFAVKYFNEIIWSKTHIERCKQKDPEATKGLLEYLQQIPPKLGDRLSKSIELPITPSSRHYYETPKKAYMWLYPLVVLDIFNETGEAPLKSQLIMPKLANYVDSYTEQTKITLEMLAEFYHNPKAEKPLHRFLLTLADHLDISDIAPDFKPIPFSPVELEKFNSRVQQKINPSRHPILTALDILAVEKFYYKPVIPKSSNNPKPEVDLEL